MNPGEVPPQHQLENQISVPPVVLLPSPGALANLRRVTYPNLTAQLFEHQL